MHEALIEVEGYVATPADETNVRENVLELALDQRIFGARRLVVAFAGADGRLLSLAHTARTLPPELALGPCIEYVGRGAVAAVAFCDEAVVNGAPPPDLAVRFVLARSICEQYGIHLVDWFACDDVLIRSTRLALGDDGPWWNVP